MPSPGGLLVVMERRVLISWFLLITVTAGVQCVDVHFENKDGGFFLRHVTRGANPPSSSASSTEALLSVDRFTVFQGSQPVSVRASYGPFSTKQTVPARFLVPDPLLPSNITGSEELQDFATHHLDVSAHVVRTEIPRDSPQLRVLFHAGADPGSHRQLFPRHHQKLCIILHAVLPNHARLVTACSPDGEDGVCLAEITVPSAWWPPLPPPDKDGRPGKMTKTPPKLVQISYAVLEPRAEDGDNCQPHVQFQPLTSLGVVPLVPAKAAYKELKLAEGMIMLIPHPPLFPLSRLHIPVFIERERAKVLTAIIMKARVKSGLRILEATPSSAWTWNISTEINPRQTGATVSLVRKEPPETEMDSETSASVGDVVELFTWLIEIGEDAAELYEGAKVVWSMKLEPHQEDDGPETHRMDGRKSTSRFDVQKDDIQAVVPISKNWEVLNTAVLTGRQVSQAMKVLIVSQAGKAADVTFQASCHSEDDSVLKVSSSCSSVYVDGSEARGSVNGSVLVKYGTYTGLAKFTVWMPEFPLDLQVPDVRLSQVKSWKVADSHPGGAKIKRRRRSYGPWTGGMMPDDLGNVIERPTCRLRYQQSTVDVFAHFMANDHDSGRVTYLVNRRTWLRVTELVLPLLRVSDPRIASLRGRILQGRSMGRTEVQVLSPITGRVIGAKEVRVGNDKVGISRLAVQVVSGLQLNISPDGGIENGYVAETSVTRKLTAQYQEGLLDIDIEFSDGSAIPLREVAEADYHLVVESLDPEVVAFAPMVASHHPRVIAVGEGNGDLLQVTLLLPEECRSAPRPKMKSSGPLASAAASVTVDFGASDLPHRPDILQNDGGSFSGSKGGRDFHDLQDILKGDPGNKGDDEEPNVQARQHKKGKPGANGSHATFHMTPLEISMYVLLAVFCFAIAIFVVSCMVYASKFKPADVAAATAGVTAHPLPTVHLRERKPRETTTTTNAHDWVWLGRATLEHSNRNSCANNNNANSNANEMRITTNPLSMNYCEPDDCVPASFSNPTHIELPSTSALNNINNNNNGSKVRVDSTTYCKSKRGGGNLNSNATTNNDEVDVWNKPTPPPPLPPHAIPIERHHQQQQHPADGDEAAEYRPPVPPHRNIGVSARNSMVEASPPRKHHHHHHRNSKYQESRRHTQQEAATRTPEYKNQVRKSPRREEAIKGDGEQKEEIEKTVFEFDDEMPMRTTKGEVEAEVEFVLGANGNGSAEVKRATIVGNPMFSAEEQLAIKDETPAELSGLDELGMDYEQIMHYFENLKESNA